MSMKSLRLDRNWSQEQLAQISGLNVRTIQRVEKGEAVGLETMKSLAAVFEMSLDELKGVVDDKDQTSESEEFRTAEQESLREQAKEKVKSIRNFYFFSGFLVMIFLLFYLPNYNDGENLGPLIVTFISFVVLIGVYAFQVFQPFGEKWEQQKIKKILSEQSEQENSKSD